MKKEVIVTDNKHDINEFRSLIKAVDRVRESNASKTQYELDLNGRVRSSINNYLTYLSQSEKYKDKLRYNEFTKQQEFNGRAFNEFDLNILYNDIERELGISSRKKADSALMEVFNKNKYNPIIDYLNSVQWDGEKRIEKLFIDLLDADDTELNRYMTKVWFVAAVKRIFEPGCKFDNMIVLQGEQGIGKTSICDLISLNYSNNISLNEIGSKDLINKLNRTWIAVVDELDSFNKKEMSNIKTFISTRQDTARLAYGRYAESYLRHNVFIGSTNDTTFLRDNTSIVERRFWVIKCHKTSKDGRIFEVLTDDYIGQLWAEAVHYYKENPNMYLDIPKKMMEDFSKEMQQFKTYTDDVVIDYVNSILDKQYKLNQKGEFESEMDFLEQYNGDKNYGDLIVERIDKIPFSYLRFVLKRVYNEERKGSYIGNGLGDKWKYKSIRYKDNSCKGFERQNVTENDSLFEHETDEDGCVVTKNSL